MSNSNLVLQDKEGDTSYRAPRVACSMNDFEILGRAGDGSFSTVIKAKYKGDGKIYALKIIDKYFANKHKQIDRIVLERNVLDRLDHDGIVKLEFTFQDSDNLCIPILFKSPSDTFPDFVLEYLPGGELRRQILEREKLDLDSSRFYAAEVVQILEYLRKQFIVHRDLKPENLILTKDGHLKLIDFGTVKDLRTVTDPSFIRRSSFVGTAVYVSPETLKSEEITYASDLWGLGCIIYKMLYGKPPFQAASEYLIYQKIAALDYSFPEDFPASAKDLVSRLLVEEPSKRLGCWDLTELKQHAFFEGIEWENLRNSTPPKWIPPIEEGEERLELNWELKSIFQPSTQLT